jgi:hypothetical protein
MYYYGELQDLAKELEDCGWSIFQRVDIFGARSLTLTTYGPDD